MPFLKPYYLQPSEETSPSGNEFVLEYLQALGVRIEPRGASLVRVEMNREQLCELENRPANTWYAMSSIPELTTLYLTLDQQPTDEERAETAAPGSWRFDQMRGSARRIGAVTRLRVIPKREDEGLLYRPILIFGFEVLFCCSRQKSSLLPVAVDMVTGASSKALALSLLQRKMDERLLPRLSVRPREMRYKHAFEIACEWVKECISRDQATWDWYYRAAYRLGIELEQVEEYFTQRARDGEQQLDPEREHAVAEVKKRFKPKVEARTLLGVLVFCPEDEILRT